LLLLVYSTILVQSKVFINIIYIGGKPEVMSERVENECTKKQG